MLSSSIAYLKEFCMLICKKNNKNDYVDVDSLCQVASRPPVCFILPKTENQQVRHSLNRDKVKTTNQKNAHLIACELPSYLVQMLSRLQTYYCYLYSQIK